MRRSGTAPKALLVSCPTRSTHPVSGPPVPEASAIAALWYTSSCGRQAAQQEAKARTQDECVMDRRNVRHCLRPSPHDGCAV